MELKFKALMVLKIHVGRIFNAIEFLILPIGKLPKAASSCIEDFGIMNRF